MIYGWRSDISNRNETEDLITVKLHDTKVNIEEDISISLQSDTVSEIMNTFRTTVLANALISSLDKLYATIDFLRAEIEEKNIIIKTLTSQDANDGKILDILESTNISVIETMPSTSDTQNSSRIDTPFPNDTQRNIINLCTNNDNDVMQSNIDLNKSFYLNSGIV